MMAKQAFYAAGAVLMLALAYHLGARDASAQAPGPASYHITGSGYVACPSGAVYECVRNGATFFANALASRPGRSVSDIGDDGSNLYVILDSGELMVADKALPTTFVSWGFAPGGGTTAVVQRSLGAVKAGALR